MKKFLVTYHVPAEAMAQMANVTPEQQAEGMKLWGDWFQKMGDHVVDMGSPLMGSLSLNNAGSFTPGTKQFSGYTIIQAQDMEQAKELVKGNPHTIGWHPDTTLELHETMPLPGM